MGEVRIVPLEGPVLAAYCDSLAELLHACVHAGASVGFVLPFELSGSRVYWTETVFPAVSNGRRILLVAMREGQLAGTVQLNLDNPPNQAHRAEVSKLLVHPGLRRLGTARLLMVALEERARGLGRKLLTLDTRTGDTAEPLYRSLGYKVAGSIPGYCRDPLREIYDATTYMYKELEPV